MQAYLGIWPNYVATAKHSRGVRKEKLHKFFHYYYFLIILLYAGALSLVSFEWLIYGYCLPACMCFHGASLIVTLGHSSHEKSERTGDYSRNSVLLHWLTWGEGLHYQHHRRPSQSYFSDQPWYFLDLPGLTIKYLLKSKPSKAQQNSEEGLTSATWEREDLHQSLWIRSWEIFFKMRQHLH